MDDLMARTIVENLAIGINPLTGEALPDGDVCNNEVVQAALETVLENCSLESYATAIHKTVRKKKKKIYMVKDKDAATGKSVLRELNKGQETPAKDYDEVIKSLCRQIQKKNRESKG